MDEPNMKQSAANQELIDLIKSYLDPETQISSDHESEAKAREIFKKYRENRKSNPEIVGMDDALRNGILECGESICSRIEGKSHEHYPVVVVTPSTNPGVKDPVVTSCQEQPKEQGDRCVKGLVKYGPKTKLFSKRPRHFIVVQVMDDEEKGFANLVLNIFLNVLASINRTIRG